MIAAQCPRCGWMNGSISNFILPAGGDRYSEDLICPSCRHLVHVNKIPVKMPESGSPDG